MLLLGGFDHGEPFIMANTELTTSLDELVKAGGNYLRNTMADFTESIGGENRLQPFHRRADGLFDLSEWNETYWSQLNAMLSEADKRNVIVSIELWDPWYLRDGQMVEEYWWSDGPWSPAKNINYTTTTGLSDGYSALPYEEINPFYNSIVGTDEQKLNMTAVFAYQKSFVDKILSTTMPYKNILFQIDNESFAPTEWVDFWANYIHVNSDGRYVTDMHNERNLDLPAARHAINNPSYYDFADASQNEITNTRDEFYSDLVEFRYAMINSGYPRPINHVKIYSRYNNLGDTDPDLGIDRFFMNIFAGSAAARFHQRPVGEGLSAEAKRAIMSARWLDDSVNLALMKPISLDSWRWVFRRKGEVYAMEGDNIYVFGYTSFIDGACTDDEHVCLDEGEGIKFNMNSIEGAVTLTWFNADTGQILDGGTASTSRWVDLRRPDRPSNTRWLCIARKLE
jgi:hypothetical protein